MKLQQRFLAIAFACGALLAASMPARSAPSSMLYRATIEDPDVTATCALLFNRTAMLLTPQVTLIHEVPGIVVVHFSLFDASGGIFATHDVDVPPPNADGTRTPLAAFRIDRTFGSVSCGVRTASQASSKGMGAGPIVLGVLAAGGLVAIASSHGGGGASISTPTTAPTVTPTPSPTATPAPVVVTPSSLVFSGSTTSLTATASEIGYTGNFTASGTGCSSIATITPTTSAGPFTVNALAAGTCSFTLADTSGRSATVAVTVSTTSGTIHARTRASATAQPRKLHQ